MFTGIIQDIGDIIKFELDGDARATIETKIAKRDLGIGASICCSGACMTVVSVDKVSDEQNKFAIEISKESLSKTNLGSWNKGVLINLEPSLRLGDEMGGHIVSGHIDGLAKIIGIKEDAHSKRFIIEIPKEFQRFIASKGSVALDGVSLTVNEVDNNIFGVNIIPHTLEFTTFGIKRVGDLLNFEVDSLARYVDRMINN